MDILVVGLGNPGAEYEGSRHNIGFDLVDEFARYYRSDPWKAKWQGLGCGVCCQGVRLFLLKPQTFMNRSGASVARYYRFFNLPPEKLLVIHDDLDMPVARVKLVKGGGNGGHNGIRSLVSSLGTNGFFRLKIGIGRPGQGDVHPDFPVERYVLGRFTREDKEKLIARRDALVAGLDQFILGDIARAMGNLNSLR